MTAPWPHDDLDYDFETAFYDADEVTTAVAEPGGAALPTLKPGDVESVLHFRVSYEGETWEPGDGSGRELELSALVRLTDGRYAAVNASNDYTGWGCRSGSDVRVGTFDQVVRYGLDKDERAAFGLSLEDE